jgi:hypothetical protein
MSIFESFASKALVVKGNRVLITVPRPLKPFPGGINKDLLKRVRENPAMNSAEFVRDILGNTSPALTTGARSLARGGITPKMLCMVDPEEWIPHISPFGKVSADLLTKAIREWKPPAK